MEPQANHILGKFDDALTELQNSVLTMASITLRNLENVRHGLLGRNNDACYEVIGQDDEVDEFERSIDRDGMELILRFSPVAKDLRKVLGVVKISSNLERVSDQAVGIAKRARKMNKRPEVAVAKTVEPVYELALDLMSDSVKAFSGEDAVLARKVIERDDELDKAHVKLIKQFTKLMETDTENLRSYLHLIFIVRFLERVGDHAANIAEDVVFIQEAEDIRHGN